MNLLKLEPNKITSLVKQGKVPLCIVGLGHVGLPLAILFASEGARVIGCDKDANLLGRIRKGESPIVEHSTSLFRSSRVLQHPCPNCGVKLLRSRRDIFCPHCMKIASIESGRVRLTAETHRSDSAKESSQEIEVLLKKAIGVKGLSVTDQTTEAVRKSDVIIITVGTPIDEHKRPNPQSLITACTDIGRGLRKGSLVILKSTVSPGTTEELVAPILSRESGLEAGRDFGLAHMPERTLEGLALFELRTLARIVGGVDRRSSKAAAAVFRVFEAPIFIFDSPRVTEAAKLFENIYRDVSIALANELALACEALNLDVTKVIEAAHTDPKTHLLMPGPGVGGYCLTKDTYYLTDPASRGGFTPRIVKTAREVNDEMPNHVVELIKDGYEELGLTISGSRIGVLGLAFKGNTADTRNSPSIPIIQALHSMGASLAVHDPLASFDNPNVLDHNVKTSRNVTEIAGEAACLVLLTDHLEYRSLTPNYVRSIAPNLKLIVDARHIFNPEEVLKAGLAYRGVGRRARASASPK